MTRLLPLLVLMLALPAVAGDTARGKKTFNNACGQCHSAGPASRDPQGAPQTENLAVWLSKHSSAELSQWVANPWKINPKTRCDPRQLQPQNLTDLLSFLRGAQGSTRAP